MRALTLTVARDVNVAAGVLIDAGRILIDAGRILIDAGGILVDAVGVLIDARPVPIAAVRAVRAAVGVAVWVIVSAGLGGGRKHEHDDRCR